MKCYVDPEYKQLHPNKKKAPLFEIQPAQSFYASLLDTYKAKAAEILFPYQEWDSPKSSEELVEEKAIHLDRYVRQQTEEDGYKLTEYEFLLLADLYPDLEEEWLVHFDRPTPKPLYKIELVAKHFKRFPKKNNVLFLKENHLILGMYKRRTFDYLFPSLSSTFVNPEDDNKEVFLDRWVTIAFLENYEFKKWERSWLFDLYPFLSLDWIEDQHPFHSIPWYPRY